MRSSAARCKNSPVSDGPAGRESLVFSLLSSALVSSVFSLRSSVWRLSSAAFLTGTLCAGCAVTPDTPVDGWPAERDALVALENWSLKGRIAVATEEQGVSGSIRWQQDTDRTDFSFRGPLGSGSFRIQGDDDSLRLTTKDGSERVLDDPDSGFREALGFDLPFRNMRYWVRGVPAPSSEAETRFGSDGRLDSFSQAGWSVEYTSFVQVESRVLPRRLTIGNGDVRLKLGISEWTLGSGAEGT